MPFVLLSSDGTQRADTEPLRAPRVRVALKPLDSGLAVLAVDAEGTLRPIGWLDAAVAESYRRVLAPLAEAGMYGTCIAETVPDGTVLRLGPAETCLAGVGWRTPGDDGPDVDPNAATAVLPRAGRPRRSPVVALPGVLGATPPTADHAGSAGDTDPSVIGTSPAARFRAAGTVRAAWRRTDDAEPGTGSDADQPDADTATGSDTGHRATGRTADSERGANGAAPATAALATAALATAALATAALDTAAPTTALPTTARPAAVSPATTGPPTTGPESRRPDGGRRQSGRSAAPRILAAVIGLLMVAAAAQALTAGSAGGGVVAAADQNSVPVPGWTGPPTPTPDLVAATPTDLPPTSAAAPRQVAAAPPAEPPAPPVAETGSASEPTASGSSGEQHQDEHSDSGSQDQHQDSPPAGQHTDGGNQDDPRSGDQRSNDDNRSNNGGNNNGGGSNNGGRGNDRDGRDGRSNDRSFNNCVEAWLSGAAPIRRGEPGYSRRLDQDGDGVACERF